MHRVYETAYGYRLNFEGSIEREGVGALLDEMKRVVRPHPGGIAVLVDMHQSRALTVEAQEILKEAIAVCKQAGMNRNLIVLDSAIATLQARRIAEETGIADFLRYLDASSSADWERIAVGWLVDGTEPNLQ